MKINKNLIATLTIAGFLLTACGQDEPHSHKEEDHGHEHHDHHEEEGLHLSLMQFKALDMQVGELPSKNLSDVVEANGKLEVPPQNEATVTAIIGANVVSIKVIEGDDVKKGQVLAYLSHPNLTQLQSNYLQAYNREHFLKKDYQRQKKLYEAEVGSGKAFQQAESDLYTIQGLIKSYESQLRQLGIDPLKIRKGDLYDKVPVVSPIKGSVTKVEIKTGQFVQPEKDLFEIVNVEHIHADLMVFEKDIHKVKKGQRIRFSVENMPNEDLRAKIYSVGKKFEQNPKAVHIHAEIENRSERLIPGMYIRGKILMDSSKTFALPEAAIVREGEQYFAFMAKRETDGEEEWSFTPIELKPGITNDGWTGVDLLEEVDKETLFALNNAYYLMAEMNKEEAEHSH